MQTEWQMSKLIQTVDPDQRYFIYAMNHCDVKASDMVNAQPKSRSKQCDAVDMVSDHVTMANNLLIDIFGKVVGSRTFLSRPPPLPNKRTRHSMHLLHCRAFTRVRARHRPNNVSEIGPLWDARLVRDARSRVRVLHEDGRVLRRPHHD
jgi:hypothetical protein